MHINSAVLTGISMNASAATGAPIGFTGVADCLML